jgi:purine-nucleoside phosphorylase
MPMTLPGQAAQQAAAAIAQSTGAAQHQIAVIMGSGWQSAAAAIGEPAATIPMAGLPGFSAPAALGHQGVIHSVPSGPARVLVMMGRSHLYEGNAPAQVVHPVATAIAAGATTILLTNAAGGIRPGLRVGEPVLISDQLNLTQSSPLEGATFVDMVNAYDPGLRDLARHADRALTSGVYAGLRGPQYESPAEVKMLRAIGADLVGMSTVLETIAARSLGARVLGISLVTNLAAGATGQPLSHAEVLAEGQAAAPRLGRLLHAVLGALGQQAG